MPSFEYLFVKDKTASERGLSVSVLDYFTGPQNTWGVCEGSMVLARPRGLVNIAHTGAASTGDPGQAKGECADDAEFD
jgi:hypothetical protein